MSSGTLPVAASDLGALMPLGFLQSVGRHPLTLVCLVKGVGRPDSIWIDLGYPGLDYRELWRAVYPDGLIPAGYEVGPLLSPQQARREGFRLVRLGLIGLGGAVLKPDGQYLLTGVDHTAKDVSYG